MPTLRFSLVLVVQLLVAAVLCAPATLHAEEPVVAAVGSTVASATPNQALNDLLTRDLRELLASARSSREAQPAAERALAQNAAPATNASAAPTPPKPRRLEEAEVCDLLVEALKHQRDDGDATWELTFTRTWTPVTVPEGPLVAEILEPPLDRMTSTPIFRFQLRSGRTTLGSWQVPARVRLLREVVVAHGTLQRGQSLGSAEIVREPRDVLSLRQPVFDVPANPEAYELTEMVTAGSPLTARSLRLKPVVMRGQLADATVRDGAMTISLKVEVLEEGVPGQVIRVRNPQSHRELRGKVEDEKTIVITL